MRLRRAERNTLMYMRIIGEPCCLDTKIAESLSRRRMVKHATCTIVDVGYAMFRREWYVLTPRGKHAASTLDAWLTRRNELFGAKRL